MGHLIYWYATDILKALTPLVIGALAGWIAWRQSVIANRKLNLDLYDRRFKVYEALMKFLRDVTRTGAVSPLEVDEFNQSTDVAVFLFKGDVKDYIAKVRRKALDARVRSEKLANRDLPIGPERNKLADEDAELLNWLSDQYTEAPKVFARYLYFGNVR